MKALSIKQPWASLIAHGIKNIENRSWRTKFRGRIYIHASAKSASSLFSNCLNIQQSTELGRLMPFKDITDNYVNKLEHSAIIGEVDIVDCVINHESVWAEKCNPSEDSWDGWAYIEGEKPIYNWVLANPVLYAEPILNVKGKLSFWEYNKL